ncbi:hypothetical protein AVEN_227137-1 [Araneus ventricosus]|uniref:Uncharacterized protein n=1 Tax=Araneus ventricosus TaxID=182803 RepID=A0A4Y2BUG1_ARAVE|nr:hypothetical protein AVEN_227137-1 [Araneus ventricosus]
MTSALGVKPGTPIGVRPDRVEFLSEKSHDSLVIAKVCHQNRSYDELRWRTFERLVAGQSEMVQRSMVKSVTNNDIQVMESFPNCRYHHQ